MKGAGLIPNPVEALMRAPVPQGPNPHPPLLLQGNQLNQILSKYSRAESTKYLVLTVVSILCIVGVLLASTVVYCLRHRSHHKLKEKLTNLGTDTASDATATYQVGGAPAGGGWGTGRVMYQMLL